MKQKSQFLVPGWWGTALAQTLAENGHDVRIWGNVPEQIDEINTYHTNQHFFLPDLTIQNRLSDIKKNWQKQWMTQMLFCLSFRQKQSVQSPRNLLVK